MLRIDVLTIFPELFEGFTSTSILGAALSRERLSVVVHDLRSFTQVVHTVWGESLGTVEEEF